MIAAAAAGHHRSGGRCLGRRHDIGGGRGAGNGLQSGCGTGHYGRYVAGSDTEVLSGEDGASGADGVGPGHDHPTLVVCGDGRVVLVQVALAVDHKLLAVGVAAAHDAVAAQVLPH